MDSLFDDNVKCNELIKSYEKLGNLKLLSEKYNLKSETLRLFIKKKGFMDENIDIDKLFCIWMLKNCLSYNYRQISERMDININIIRKYSKSKKYIENIDMFKKKLYDA